MKPPLFVVDLPDLFNLLEIRLALHHCDGTLQHVESWANEQPDKRDSEKILRFLRQRNLICDCRVFYELEPEDLHVEPARRAEREKRLQ